MMRGGDVALHVRAWVEIILKRNGLKQVTVALHVRAWVEIEMALVQR